MKKRMTKPIILIVEDDKYLQKFWKKLLKEVRVLSAYTVKQAEILFSSNRDKIELIAMDACVPGDAPTTLPLTREIRKVFKKPMVAMSSSSDYRKELLRAGCSHECPNKVFLTQEIIKILKKGVE